MEQEPIRIAVFDLNQTVYRKSSKDEFFKYICYKKNYKLLDIFQIGLFYALKKLKLVNKTVFKENFFHYLDELPPQKVHKFASQFWRMEWDDEFNHDLLQRIEKLRKQGIKIFFSTGGLDVYVAPLFENHLKVDEWMATETRYVGGSYKIEGKALKDEEKIRRLDEYFGSQPYTIVEAFSDSKEAILKAAQKAYLMRGGKPIPFEG